MKHFLLTCLSFTLLFSCKKETDYLVKYNFTFAPDSLNITKIVSEEMILSTNNQGYAYMSNALFTSDTIGNLTDLIKQGKLSFSDFMNQKGQGSQNIKLYFNKDSNAYHIHTSIDGLSYKFKDDVTKLTWELVDEEKRIQNYKAKKAKTKAFGKNWTAWYTEKIPVAYGPYKFQGLPGLILELSDDKNNFKFDLVEAKIDTTKYPIYEKANEVNSKRIEFENKIKEIKNNPVRITSKTGDDTVKDKKYLDLRKEEFLKKNNSIEKGLQFNL
ncbi:GLPGLI family protein [Faecalibacter sp. LW9]|uniref:GLPGLI family protein n=1 Tax=Faecalibacter sp. LW9 TaxID=3103144 RepID=UPI002AFFFBF7|nr:GLPGLI family protein [Faecalibacter sp. LW9]